MSNQLSELIYENKENYLNFENNSEDKTPSFLNISNEISTSSIESKSDEIYKHYFFLCKFCEKIPLLDISKNGKISYKCKCENEYKDLSIEEIYNNLFYSEDFESENEKLKCFFHGDKYSYYCKKCNDNFCIECSKDCKEHRNELVMFGIDDNDTIEKIKYIKEKTLNNDNIKENANIIPINSQNIIENDESNEDKIVLIRTDKINNENNINDNNNNDEIINIKYINLFKIIFNNYENFPNYNLLQTISNIERFVSLYFKDYNEIDLYYEFNKENINDKKVELFDDKFVTNNKENCFLIIEEKRMELIREINLEIIFDVIPSVYPIYLEVKLIERKRKLMTNLSFMFNEISTITDKSSFDNYDTSNIKEMAYMFYNCQSNSLPNISNFKTHNVIDINHMFCKCSSVKELPDISKWETKNVTDMSFMFNDCLSLNELPNISKWNMENVIDTSSMFEQCNSITSLPNISNWKLSKIKYMNKMFRNCRNLSDLPELDWEINNDTETKQMFEGDLLLENLPTFRIRNNLLFKCCSIFNEGANKVIIFFKIFGLPLYYIGGALFIIIGYLIPYYTINYLENTKKCINNPIIYFNLLNKINITYIAEFKKITNKSLIEEMSSNKELTIKKFLNFTRINRKITFDSDYGIYKILDIFIKNIFLFCLISLIFICINIKYTFKYLGSAKSIYLLIIIFFLAILSIILLIKNYNIISKLSKSINKYFIEIKKLFKIEFPTINIEEFDSFKSSNQTIVLLIIFFSVSFIIILVSCRVVHNAREKKYIFN